MFSKSTHPTPLPVACHIQFNSAQSLGHVRLCDPMNRSMPGLPVHHQLPEFTQTHVHRVDDAIQLSHPLSFPSPPAPNLSQHQGLFKWVSSSHQVAKVWKFQLGSFRKFDHHEIFLGDCMLKYLTLIKCKSLYFAGGPVVRNLPVRGHRFDPWSGKTPDDTRQLTPCTTVPDACTPWSLCSATRGASVYEKPVHSN